MTDPTCTLCRDIGWILSATTSSCRWPTEAERRTKLVTSGLSGSARDATRRSDVGRPLDKLHALAERYGLHVTLSPVLKRWKLGVERPTSSIGPGVRAHRDYEGMGDLSEIDAAAERLNARLVKAPPGGGS